MLTPTSVARELEWTLDEDGAHVALNPYPGDPESREYATRYVIRRGGVGYALVGEFANGEDPVGTFPDLDEAKAAAQRDADERAAPT